MRSSLRTTVRTSSSRHASSSVCIGVLLQEGVHYNAGVLQYGLGGPAPVQGGNLLWLVEVYVQLPPLDGRVLLVVLVHVINSHASPTTMAMCCARFDTVA